MAQSIRTPKRILIVLNLLVIIMATAEAGLLGKTLVWANPDGTAKMYIINEKSLLTTGPGSPFVREFPADFSFMGTRLVMAAAVFAVFCSAFNLILIAFCVRSLRSTAQLTSTNRIRAPVKTLITFTILSTTLTFIALSYSWVAYYKSPTLTLTSDLVVDRIYQPTWFSPEVWAQQLPKFLAEEQDQVDLRRRFLFAMTGRVLVMPVFGFQAAVIGQLFSLKGRLEGQDQDQVEGEGGVFAGQQAGFYGGPRGPLPESGRELKTLVTSGGTNLSRAPMTLEEHRNADRRRDLSMKSPSAWTYSPVSSA